MIVPQGLREIATTSKTPIYIVGGYVRNDILGLGDTDIDLCGPELPQALKLPENAKIEIVNFRLGTAVITYEGDRYEYTPFRTEIYAKDGHKPSSISFTTDIKKDCMRRDFTCNAIYYDIKDNKIIDLVGGVADVKSNVMRAINDRVFTVDGLRVLRLVRIAAETGFSLDATTVKQAQGNLSLLAYISNERKRIELCKLLIADTKYGKPNAHFRGVKLMTKLGLWQYIIPQLERCAAIKQTDSQEHDGLEYIMQVVRFSLPDNRIAALLHAVGQPYCVYQKGTINGHAMYSARFANNIMQHFNFDKRRTRAVAELIDNHTFDTDQRTSMGKVRLFVATNWMLIDRLVDLQRACFMAKGGRESNFVNRLLQVKQAMLDDNTPINIGGLVINGDYCIRYGLYPVNIGKFLNDMLEKCILEPRLNNNAWLKRQLIKAVKNQATQRPRSNTVVVV